MSLTTYEEARPWARAIRTAVLQKKMPPWFADAGHGPFLNDPSLSKSIPAGASNHPVDARAAVLRDVRLVSMLPTCTCAARISSSAPSGQRETLLRVSRYDFIECVGHYDNSANNPHNPNSGEDVHYGEQTWEEMLNGFMEVAIDPTVETPEILGKAPV